MILTIAQLRECMPFAGARVPIYVECLNQAMIEFDITTLQRQACFLAQVAHESGSLAYTLEIASGRDYDITVNPALAKELGNLLPGDGPKYKGAGLMMITGATNTRRCLRDLGRSELDRSYLLEPVGASRSAGWYWKDRELNVLADSGAFASLSKKINGGWNGIDERIRHYVRCRKALGI